MTEPSFDVSPADHDLIQKIAERAVDLRSSLSVLDTEMDVTACHANGCPLDLPRMLASGEAGEYDFLHDVLGIARHLDRNSGALRDCFLPRFARKPRPAAEGVNAKGGDA